ncbi:MAG: F0F1 ATP synthase subunit gamma [Lactobacillales bacterium]|jgi:F-type H+-transporting ATPase subunit gamma|nr:F0F1 ATP synthase subunit gamma [Lactobacillales bacterium]
MGANLNEIQTRIASTKKTSQITKAMQMVSAAKLGKSEAASRRYQIYANKVREILAELASAQYSDLVSTHNGMTECRPVKTTAYVVITSDKGLVGGYNSSVLKYTMNKIEAGKKNGQDYVIIALGSMGIEFFKNRGMDVAYELRGLSDSPSFEEVRKIVSTTVTMYQNEMFDQLLVCYNHHVNSMTSEPRAEMMLPVIDIESTQSNAEVTEVDGEVKIRKPYIVEPEIDAVLNVLLPQYAESLIYGAIVDAKTAEHAAGMTAMRSATDNAQNIIKDLTIQFNRARQAAITQEITEIVAGAGALG